MGKNRLKTGNGRVELVGRKRVRHSNSAVNPPLKCFTHFPLLHCKTNKVIRSLGSKGWHTGLFAGGCKCFGVGHKLDFLFQQLPIPLQPLPSMVVWDLCTLQVSVHCGLGGACHGKERTLSPCLHSSTCPKSPACTYFASKAFQ